MSHRAYRNSPNDDVFLTSGLSISIYFDVLDESQKDGILKLWEYVIPIMKPNLRWYLTDQMPGYEPVNNETMELIPFWMQSKLEKSYFTFKSHGGLSRDDISPWTIGVWIVNPKRLNEDSRPLMESLFKNSLEGYNEHANCIRFTFPDEGGFSSKLLEISKFAFENVPFLHGNSGYSLIFDDASRTFRPDYWARICQIAMRHPGYDVFVYDAVEQYVYNKIKTINWITLLGPHFSKKWSLMDHSKLDNDASIKIKQLKNKVFIQAGDAPEVGDVNKGDNLECYRHVALSCWSFLCREHFPFGGKFDEDKTIEWLDRFNEN